MVDATLFCYCNTKWFVNSVENQEFSEYSKIENKIIRMKSEHKKIDFQAKLLFCDHSRIKSKRINKNYIGENK